MSDMDVDRFEPIRMLEVELSAPIAALEPAASPSGTTYTQAIVLVRLHGEPLGMVDVELPGGELPAGRLAAAIWPPVRDAAARHLARDGLQCPLTLETSGIAAGERPACAEERDRFLLSAPSLTVVIPSRERPERLARCIDSILACEYPDDRYDVLVVDNAPETDRTAKLVERYAAAGSNVRYAREDRSGSASARNAGLDFVEHDIVVFTDDDVIVDAHWLTEVARAFVDHPEAGCVSGLLVPLELDTPAQVWFEQYGGFSRGFERKIYDLNGNRPAGNPLYPYSAGVFGTGNNMAYRRSVLDQIGRFDPALGNGTPALGGVDSEVLLRTVLCGHPVVYEPRALVHHAHRPDYSALRRQIYNYGAGLTAYLLKTLIANPRLVGDFARRVPRGLRFALDPRSSKNENKRSDYPRELTREELRGMLYGPVAYARSRRTFGPHPVPRVDHLAVAGRR